MIIRHQRTLMVEGRAKSMAREMQAGEDEGWTYVAVEVNRERGWWAVEIRDEDGELVGYA